MIKAWIDGKCFGSKGSGFAIKLLGGVHNWVRTIRCEKLTTNQTELKAFEYVLRSIAPDFVGEELHIVTTGKYAQLMLERTGDDWSKKASSNQELVGVVRDLYQQFSKITIISGEDEITATLKQLNEQAVKKGVAIFDKR